MTRVRLTFVGACTLLAFAMAASPLSLAVAPPSAAAEEHDSGYWMLDANGAVYDFGGAQHHGQRDGHASIDIEPTPSGSGYLVLEPSGTVTEFGDAASLPDPPAARPGDRWAAITTTSSGRGYWAFSSQGCVAAVGDAPHHGDMCAVQLNAPVVGSAITPSGNGYWMVAKDGGIFSYGDAQFWGSTGDMQLNQPVTGMAAAPGGQGYWLVAEDGGIFAFGAAPFYDSMGGTALNQPIVGMVGSPTGAGYLMVARDGGIFAFGDVPFHGSLGDSPPAAGVVSVAALPRHSAPGQASTPWVDPSHIAGAGFFTTGVDCGAPSGAAVPEEMYWHADLVGADDVDATLTWHLSDSDYMRSDNRTMRDVARRSAQVLGLDLRETTGTAANKGDNVLVETRVAESDRPDGWVRCSYVAVWGGDGSEATPEQAEGWIDRSYACGGDESYRYCPFAVWEGTVDLAIDGGVPPVPELTTPASSVGVDG